MSGELVRINPTETWGVARQMGDAAATTGQYGSKNAAELALRIQYGVELGMGPAAALTAPAVAGRIKASGRYNYRVTEHTDETCRIVFYEGGTEIGDSTFTMGDAQKAGLLSNATWRKYPRNMLFARALTNGARWHCPDVFGGAIYTPDELGGPLPDDENVVLGEVVEEPERPLTRAERIKADPTCVVQVLREEYPEATDGMTDDEIKDRVRGQGYRTLTQIQDGASRLLTSFGTFIPNGDEATTQDIQETFDAVREETPA